MDKKSQLGLLTAIVLVHLILGTIITVIYYDHIKMRSCDSDLMCGDNSFCDDNKRCQYKEVITRDATDSVKVNKYNFKWGIIFIGTALIISYFILRLRPQKK